MYRHDTGHVADGTNWNINFTCDEFGPKCLHLLGNRYLTVSDTTSYLYGKDKVSAQVTKTWRLPWSFHVLWRVAREQVMKVGQAFICAMYGQRRGTTVGEARYRLYKMNFGKLLKVIYHHL